MPANWLVLIFFSPSGKVFDWIADRPAESPTDLGAWGVDYFALVSSSRGTVLSFLNIDMCRCLDAKTSCKIKEVSYSQIKQLLSST
jgi:hypothetical protein